MGVEREIVMCKVKQRAQLSRRPSNWDNKDSGKSFNAFTKTDGNTMIKKIKNEAVIFKKKSGPQKCIRMISIAYKDSTFCERIEI